MARTVRSVGRAPPATLLVSIIVAALATGGSAANANAARPRFGFAFAGGGFTAMTGGMGITRALHQSGLLHKNITHMSAVSGGAWHTAPLVYSKGYYDNLTSDAMSVGKFVEEWGARYEGLMKSAVSELELMNWTFDTGRKPVLCVVEQNGTALNEIVSYVITQLTSRLVWPAINWYVYTGLILQAGGISEPNTSFTTERAGFATARQIIGASFPPNAWLDASGKETRYFRPEFESSSAVESSWEPDKFSFPIMHTVPAGATPGPASFVYAENTTLRVSQGQNGHNPITLDMGVEQSIHHVVAGSSSAAGFMASKTLLQGALTWGAQEVFNLTGPAAAAAVNALMQCFPSGLETLAAPLPPEVAPASSEAPSQPSYRYLDGAYTEGTGIAWAVSQLVSDCSNQPSVDPQPDDCGQEPDILPIECQRRLSDEQQLMNAYLSNNNWGCGEVTLAAYNDVSATDGSGSNIRDLFTTPENAGVAVTPLHLLPEAWTQPSTRVFATNYSDVEWYPYANYTYVINGSSTGPTVSYFSLTATTTVDNAWYDVRCGIDVKVIIVQPAVPPADFIISPGLYASYGFSKIYGPVAEMISTYVEPLFREPEQTGSIQPPSVLSETFCFGPPPQYQVLGCDPEPPPASPPSAPDPPATPPPRSPPPPPSLPPFPASPPTPSFPDGAPTKLVYMMTADMIADGTVDDFSTAQQDQIKDGVGETLGVSASSVILDVMSASVLIRSQVEYPTEAEANKATTSMRIALPASRDRPFQPSRRDACHRHIHPGADTTRACKLVGDADAVEAHRQCYSEAKGTDAVLVLMTTLRAGDVVLAADSTGTLSLERVVFNQHKANPRSSLLLELHYSTGVLALTPDHILLVDSTFAPARDAKPGAALALANGQPAKVERVVAAYGRIINPVTVSGTIVAGGVIAASFPEFSAALMMTSKTPFPLMYGLAAAFPETTQTYYGLSWSRCSTPWGRG